MRPNKKIVAVIVFIAVFVLVFFVGQNLNNRLQISYRQNLSPRITDRDGNLMFLRKNPQGYFNQPLEKIPADFSALLIKKEDQWFYWHKGINPVSILKNLLSRIGIGNRTGSSTISQQLAKILLKQENQRTFNNKLIETAYTFGLEFSNAKDKILTEYANSIYFGNQIQGLQTASLAYFGTQPEMLSQEQTLQLLAAINNPSNNNPLSASNVVAAKNLAANLKIEIHGDFIDPDKAKNNLAAFLSGNSPLFEIAKYLDDPACQNSQKTALDSELNKKVRQIIQEDLAKLGTKKAKNAAVVVLSLPDNEILAFSGSPDPHANTGGYKINMLNEPRQIGSTIKPFIYLKAFEKGMRPYTLIDDREYKYPAGFGFSIYPENYDRAYHGIMTAHYALANSINVAAAKTLEYADIDEFVKFLQDDMAIPAPQDYSQYQIGIALGALETDILNLARAFTIFPNEGKLSNLNLFTNQSCNTKFFSPQNKITAKKPTVELVNKILSDRAIAQDQFGAASDLNLSAKNYALKTGTSHDYTDSWIVGYTPDFLAAVWVGNADATAMEGVSGQIGAGKIWSHIMEMMLASKYNQNTQFDFNDIAEFQNENTLEYGLKTDDYENSKNLLLNLDQSLILKPHDGDIFQFEENARIILKSKSAANWQINGQNFGLTREIIFTPPSPKKYKITATSGDQKEEIQIEFVKK